MINSIKEILLVEDDLVSSMAETSILKGLGYNVKHAATGEEAVSLVESGAAFDLVIMDIMLGDGIDGIDAAGKIISLKNLPIVFLSATSSKSTLTRVEELGPHGFIFKNPDKTQFEMSLKMAMSLCEAHAKIEQREKELEFSEKIFSLFMEYSPVYVFFKDKDAKAIRLSRNYENMLGMPVEDILGKSMFEIFPYDLAKGMIEDDQKILREKKPISIDEQLSGRYYTTTKFPIMIDGVSEYLAGFTIDVTEQKNAEHALIESQRAMHTLMSNLPGMAYRCSNDTSRRLEFASDGAVELTGYSPDDIVGNRKLSFASLIHKEDLIGVWEKIEAAVAAKKPFRMEYRICPADGGEKWVEEHGVAIFSTDGKLAALEGFVFDISERKAAESAFLASELRYKSLFDQSLVGVGVARDDGTIFEANDAMLRMLRYRRDEIVGKKVSEIYADPAECQPVLETLMLEGFVSNCEVRLKRRDGEIINVLTSIARVESSSGRYLQTTCIDITDRKKAETAIANLASEKDVLLKELQHRVKNSFSLISALVGLEAGKAKDAEIKRVLDDVHDRITSLAKMYTILSESANANEIRLDKYLHVIISSLESGHLSHEKEISIVPFFKEVSVDTQIGAPAALILTELLTNAIKHAFVNRSAGRISATLDFGGGRVRLVLEDDGDPFPDGLDFTKPLGLGLQLVNMLVFQIDGNISVERDAKRFIVDFPPHEAEA